MSQGPLAPPTEEEAFPHQKELPPLPLPALSDTCERYLDTVRWLARVDTAGTGAGGPGPLGFPNCPVDHLICTTDAMTSRSLPTTIVNLWPRSSPGKK